MTWRHTLLLAVTLGVFVAVLLVEPTPQDLGYHNFGDQRTLLGIPNFFNVMTNLPFLIVGLYGWRVISRHPEITGAVTTTPWRVFFAGIMLTSVGSGYFHWQPGNTSLVWDRIPMTIAFMSLVSIVISEYFSADIGRKLLVPLLLAGIASVAYWAWTESLGEGDLRPYAVVQFLPILLIPIVISLYATRSDLGIYLWWMIGFYALAKVFEQFDFPLYEYSGVMSGHSVKHLIASLAPLSLAVGLTRRAGNPR